MRSASHNATVSNDDDLAFYKRGCCFWIPFLHTEPSHASSSWQRFETSTTPDHSPTSSRAAAPPRETWWFRGWSKIRELVAGPKWKTLVRRFNKKRGGKHHAQGYSNFHYDALSYSLNFDEGPGHYDDDDIVGRGFSSRYSLPPSAHSSLDFDGEGVVFT